MRYLFLATYVSTCSDGLSLLNIPPDYLPPNTLFSGFGEGGADHTTNETACQQGTTLKTR